MGGWWRRWSARHELTRRWLLTVAITLTPVLAFGWVASLGWLMGEPDSPWSTDPAVLRLDVAADGRVTAEAITPGRRPLTDDELLALGGRLGPCLPGTSRPRSEVRANHGGRPFVRVWRDGGFVPGPHPVVTFDPGPAVAALREATGPGAVRIEFTWPNVPLHADVVESVTVPAGGVPDVVHAVLEPRADEAWAGAIRQVLGAALRLLGGGLAIQALLGGGRRRLLAGGITLCLLGLAVSIGTLDAVDPSALVAGGLLPPGWRVAWWVGVGGFVTLGYLAVWSVMVAMGVAWNARSRDRRLAVARARVAAGPSGAWPSAAWPAPVWFGPGSPFGLAPPSAGGSGEVVDPEQP